MRLSVLLTAVVVGLGGLAWAPKEAAVAHLEKAHKKDQRIEFMHVMTDQSSTVLIVPCVKVLKSLYGHNAELNIRVTVHYTTLSGEQVTRIDIKPLSAWVLTAHHPQPAHKWAILDTTMDLSDAPADLDEPITGTASLITIGGVPTTLATF